MIQTTHSAYRHLPAEFSEQELEDRFKPTEEELAFARQTSTKPLIIVGLLLHLKLFQYLGYFVRLSDIPLHAIEFLWKHCQPNLRELTRERLADYDRSGSRKRHIIRIREFLSVREYSPDQDRWLTTVALDASETKHILEDIINVMLEQLVRERYELPSYDKLVRIARKARKQVNEACYGRLTQDLTPEVKRRIDLLLQRSSEGTYSDWNNLKREPKKPTTKEVRSYLAHVHWLQDLHAALPEAHIPPAKWQHYTIEARALDRAEMAGLTSLKRYALSVVLIKSQHSKALDDVALLMIKLIRKMDNTAQTALQKYILDQQANIDQLIARFRSVLIGYQTGNNNVERIQSLEGALNGETEDLITSCEEHLAFSDNNYYTFMLKPYRAQRSLLFNCLSILDIRCASSDRSTEHLVAFMRHIKDRKSTSLSLGELFQFTGTCGLEWIPEKWRKLVVLKQGKPGQAALLDRRYLELCILTRVKQELSSTDLYIQYSEEYTDYREELVDDRTLEQEMPLYADQVELPLSHSKVFVQHLKSGLIEMAKSVDLSFPDNNYASIFNGKLTLHRPSPKKPIEEIERVEQELKTRIPTVSIVDVLASVTRWLKLDQHMYPHSGNVARIEDPQLRFVLTAFCYGCNLGPAQIARSFPALSRKQIAWVNNKYITHQKLVKIDERIINAYRKFQLPQFWGSGKSAAADATKWDLFEQNLMSEYHIRYGGYGGLGYYLVSDTYIALFSHFIPCGVYEGTYILDLLMRNESDIQPDTLHGDTHSQNLAVFALSYLLGIKLMPRIKNVQDLIFYHPDKRHKYNHIDELFREKIDFGLIERHLKDMLRIVISIKKGKIYPSTILRKLGTRSRKNKLYFAFRELGRAVRTKYLLEYISDVDLRRVVTAATNKNEQFNEFTKWLFFGGDGIISENLRPQQQLIVTYNQLVSNMVTLYNVVKMEDAFAQMIREGWDITPEILAGFSPYRKDSTNRFGDYNVDLEKHLPPIDFNRFKL